MPVINTRVFAYFIIILTSNLGAEDNVCLAHWAFDDPGSGGAFALDRATERLDPIEGKFRFMPGVSGEAIRLDGYTTVIDRAPELAPALDGGFTIDAWVSLAAYPWSECPVLTQAVPAEHLGYRLMLGSRGEVIFEVGTGREWHSLASADWVLPLRTWVHVAGRFDPAEGLSLYVNGEPVGSLKTKGRMQSASETELRIGSLHEPAKPAHIVREWGTLPTWWTLDGQIDELRIQNRALETSELIERFKSFGDVGTPDMPLRRMPSGPSGKTGFGAHYTSLKFYEQWDDLWRVGEHADVVVQFDNSPVRLVFWRGTRYSPAWVSENHLWMADQSVEAWDHHNLEGAEGCHEHMQDRHCRYSHVRIIESNPARVVVHWRYAPVSANNSLWRTDPRTGKACWVDEYYTIYPDASGIRKVSWDTGTLGHPRQFQESLPLTHPGQYYYDVVHNPYAHVANLRGEVDTCDFVAAEPGQKRGKAWHEEWILQRYNFKSEHKPFIIFQQGNSMWLRDELDYTADKVSGCNHWPVGQAACDGRKVQASDRPGHVMGFPISTPQVHAKNGRSWWTGLYGMGQQSVDELIEMAKAFNLPPELKVISGNLESLGYDPGQRGWILEQHGLGDTPFKLQLMADEAQPLYNPVLVIRGAGDVPVQVKANGELLARGKGYRLGYRHHLEGVDLILWIPHRGSEKLEIEILPAS